MVIQRERANENEVTVHDVEEASICLKAVFFLDWFQMVSIFSIMRRLSRLHSDRDFGLQNLLLVVVVYNFLFMYSTRFLFCMCF